MKEENKKIAKYLWQGKEVKFEFGICTVDRNKEKPLWWYNYECKDYDVAVIPSIKITYEDNQQFVISNHFGVGVHKLLNGGWPNYAHFSLPFEVFELSSKKYCNIKEFDLCGYLDHEAKRREWQKENYPKEFEASERLRKLINPSTH